MLNQNSSPVQGWISRAEDVADLVIRRCKTVLPHAARVCLISTFIEDAFRMWFQWSGQLEFFISQWNVHWTIAAVFVLFNLVAQSAGCFMVLSRKKVPWACGILVFVVVLQTIGYGILFEPYFLMRNLALLGGLLLVLAECQSEHGRTLFAGLPSTGENKPREYLQLGGRVLLLLMFLTLIRFEVSFIHTIQTVGGLALMLLVAIGYKTKLCSLLLVVWLFLMNVYYNAFWKFSVEKAIFDYLKYDFFQTFSVIGGLLMLIALGPGGVSVDERKKNW